MLLKLVQGGEQPSDGLVIGELVPGESGPVDAIIDVLVDQRVNAVNGGPEGFRGKGGRTAGPGPELGFEVNGDVREIVADDALGHAVPEHRHRDVTVVARLGGL